jgi:hypothetical protein
MSQFLEDVFHLHRLLCIEENSTDLQKSGISQIREDRVLELTARYIRQLEGVQQRHDQISTTFVSRVRPQLCRDVIDDQSLDFTCNRFLAGIGATLRREIPSSMRGSERSRIRRLAINWTNGGAEALWEGSGSSFQLRALLLFCARHSGGADNPTRQVIADQLLQDLHDGIATIPRFTLVAHDHRQSILEWGTAVVSINDATAHTPQHDVVVETAQKALLSCVEDIGAQFEHDIHESLLENNNDWESLTLEATFQIDDADEPEEGGAEEELERVVTRAVTERGENEDRLIQAMGISAFKSVMAGIATKSPQEVVNHRIAAVKKVKGFMQKQRKKRREPEPA